MVTTGPKGCHWSTRPSCVRFWRQDVRPDKLVPKVNGGVALHKIFGLMHDTCSTANRVAELMSQLREEKARAYHGEEAWAAADDRAKVVRTRLP